VQHRKKQSAGRCRPTQRPPKRDRWRPDNHPLSSQKRGMREGARPHTGSGIGSASIGQMPRTPWNRISPPPPPTDPPRTNTGNQASGHSHQSSTTEAQVDLKTSEPPTSLNRAKGETRAETKNPWEEATTPRNKFSFGLPGMLDLQAQKKGANTNPFANANEGSRSADRSIRVQEDEMEGWSFQGQRKHAPKLASPRPEAHFTLPRTPQQDSTPGGKRGQLHSEVHPSYFSSLGMTILDNGEPE
jgi:hypothetical protein